MSLSKNLRSRKSVDYKKLNEGEELPRILTTKHAVRTPATVLPDSYSVERIIDRKETTEPGLCLNWSETPDTKLNDTIKFIHQKKSGKQNQAFDELVVRKRMEFLTEQDCERKKNAYTKRNLDYWEVGKKELANAKKRKIESEIVAEHEKYLQDLKANEKPLEEMTVAELKDKLKTLGKTTKIRKKEKLIALIRETETHV